MKGPYSIRARLQVLVLAAVLPLSILIGVTIVSRWKAEHRRQGEAAIQIARVVRSLTIQALGDAMSLMGALVERPLVRAMDPARPDTALAELIGMIPDLRNAVLFDTAGRVIQTVHALPGPLPTMGNEAWFKRTLESKTPQVSEPMVGPFTGSPVVFIARAIPATDGRTGGVLAVTVDLRRFGSEFNDVALPPGAVVTILDREGYVVARTPDTEQWVGRRSSDKTFSAATNRPEGWLEATWLDGIRRLYGFTTVPETGWRIYGGIPTEMVAGPLRAASMRAILITLGVLVPVLLATHVIGKRISSSIAVLAATANRVAGGDLAARVVPHGPREVRELGEALNEMVARRAEAEAALRRSEENYRLTLDASEVGVWEFDCVTERIVWTGAHARLFGIEESEFNETLEGNLKYIQPEVLEGLRTELSEAVAGRRDFEKEVRIVRPDGSVRWLEARGRPEYDTAGKALRVRGIVMDITRPREAEEDRRRLEARLRQGRLLSAMGELVASVAHEVRNPLFGITSTVEALQLKTAKRPELVPYTDVLLKESRRLSALMTSILEYWKPAELAFEWVTPVSILGEARDMAQAELQRAGARLEFVEEGTIPPLMADRPRLVRLLRNLVENAAQHSPPGGVIEVRFAFAAREGVDGVTLMVTDGGPGFSPGELSRVFDRFESHRMGGTGLGLAIVKRIVEEHGGQVSAENVPGGGARVLAWIPRRDVAAPVPVGGRA